MEPAAGAPSEPSGFTLCPAGDAAVMIRFGSGLSAAGCDRVHAALAALDGTAGSMAGGRPGWPAGWIDVMPGYASIVVVFDPVLCSFDDVAAVVRAALVDDPRGAVAPAPRQIEIPTVYHPDVAPDLVPLAAEKGLTVDRLVALHAAPLYVCQMLGFRPGFPFLRGLDPALVSARLATPRLRVESGSVGIGGAQTGVYPSPGPGGWRIIGRTSRPLVDAAAAARNDPDQAFLVRPGDTVRFVPLDRVEAS
ncbi:MAG TPA: 5-oxoprolinase subunit PxpB [Polyangia bacterium]